MKKCCPLLILFGLAFLTAATLAAQTTNANRLTYLDDTDPFYPRLTSPKLTTPQWIGESGVDAVVILAIDDLRETKRYETFLRPILDRLKKIDGRAPVSVMTCSYATNDLPQFESWLKEGLSIEAHTLGHPCPLLQRGDFAAAESNFFGCIDLLAQIPGNHAVAFRMPCCDSMNSPSPRFYAEIFNRASPAGNFLQIDSSVMNITTPKDKSLPRELVLDADGREKFRKYLPTETNATTKVSMKSFTTTIEDYPYPYVIDKVCWEFPCALPSDWESFNLQGATNPVMLADWKAGLDATVIKQGVFTMIFHPYGWSSPQQLAELIDYADKKYGKRVKFLTFKEALERLTKNFLHGKTLRTVAAEGLLLPDVPGSARAADDRRVPLPALAQSSKGIAFRDIDNCGQLELIVSDPKQNTIFNWSEQEKTWKQLPITLPQLSKGPNVPGVVESNSVITVSIVDEQGHDNGLRFVDLNGDGYDDIVFSNEKYFGIWLWVPTENKRLGWKVGWTDEIVSGKRGDPGEIPMIVRGGAHPNNGVWFKDGFMWVQNEDTANLPDKVDRRSFHELLTAAQPRAKSPRDSLAAIRVRPGFKVELVAGEPLIESPIAMDWSADGRLWVVEMPDYPLGLDGKGKPGGRVRILEDTDGDGIYDKSTLFLDDLNFPTGIMAWRDGVIIGAAPEIFFAGEKNGKCTSRKTLYTGFREGNQQHRLNGFDYGLDGWIYGANGDSGGEVKSIATGKTIDLRGHDFRFRPDTGEFEAIEGQTQYGRHRDDWGNWFGNNNPNWLWHYFLPERYLKRNPFLSVKTTKRMLADYPESTRCFPMSRTLQRFNDFFAYNHVTSGNSATPYRDDLFGPEFATSIFISEPVHNLVHREILEPDGVSFTSHRAADETNSEFLASSDNWFRPTMLKTGPDGALYIADMYRLVIEHPEWIPPAVQKQYDLRAGADKGRIYRVYREDRMPRKIPNLQALETARLVAAMESPNGWQRDTAQRLLMERQDRRAVEPLKKLVTESPSPKTRIGSLGALDGLNGLDFETLTVALKDSDPRVRTAAVRSSEGRLHWLNSREYYSWPANIRAFVTVFGSLVNDQDPRVRYQLAFSLGEWRQGHDPLMQLYWKERTDSTMRLAILSSAALHGTELLAAIKKAGVTDTEANETVALLQRLGTNSGPRVQALRVITETNVFLPARRAARQKVLQQYASVNGLKGDTKRGAELYKQNCATCHRFQNEGTQVGPDLGIMAGKPVDENLVAILDPNAAVDPAFVNYIVATRNGRELNGIIVSETVNGITLRMAGGVEETLLRGDVRELRDTGGSLMPEGLEVALTPRDVADVIAYIRGE